MFPPPPSRAGRLPSPHPCVWNSLKPLGRRADPGDTGVAVRARPDGEAGRPQPP